MLNLISSIFSYLKKKKRIQVLSGFFLIFLIVTFFLNKDNSDSRVDDEEKTSSLIKEIKGNKSNSLTKNTEVDIEKKNTEQIDVDDLLKSKISEEKISQKISTKNKLETSSKNNVKQPTKKLHQEKKITISETPKQVVNNLHIGLKKISEKNIKSYNNLISLVKNTYNTETMIAKIIGDTWKKISRKEKDEIVTIFQEYIAINYFKRFKKIKNPTFIFKESKKIGEKFILVKTNLVVDKEEGIPINYLLLLNNNKWRIFDVLLAGSISEIATKKSEFSRFISDGKITPLINALKKQNSILNN